MSPESETELPKLLPGGKVENVLFTQKINIQMNRIT
jgi:hypothetical protein